jgi:hypothetical protein
VIKTQGRQGGQRPKLGFAGVITSYGITASADHKDHRSRVPTHITGWV